MNQWKTEGSDQWKTMQRFHSPVMSCCQKDQPCDPFGCCPSILDCNCWICCFFCNSKERWIISPCFWTWESAEIDVFFVENLDEFWDEERLQNLLKQKEIDKQTMKRMWIYCFPQKWKPVEEKKTVKMTRHIRNMLERKMRDKTRVSTCTCRCSKHVLPDDLTVRQLNELLEQKHINMSVFMKTWVCCFPGKWKPTGQMRRIQMTEHIRQMLHQKILLHGPPPQKMEGIFKEIPSAPPPSAPGETDSHSVHQLPPPPPPRCICCFCRCSCCSHQTTLQ